MATGRKTDIFTALLVVLIISFGAGSAVAEDLKAVVKSLDLIAKFADELCAEVEATGGEVTAKMEAEAKAKLSKLMKRIVDLGVAMKGTGRVKLHVGVRQEDIPQLLLDRSACRLKVFKYLAPRLIKDGYVPGSPSVRIMSPRRKCPHECELEGTYDETLDNSELWLVVKPLGSPKYYPSDRPIDILPDRKWHVTAYLGRNERADIGQRFVVLVVRASREASDKFLEYWRAQKPYNPTGLEKLPNGAIPITSVVIERE